MKKDYLFLSIEQWMHDIFYAVRDSNIFENTND